MTQINRWLLRVVPFAGVFGLMCGVSMATCFDNCVGKSCFAFIVLVNGVPQGNCFQVQNDASCLRFWRDTVDNGRTPSGGPNLVQVDHMLGCAKSTCGVNFPQFVGGSGCAVPTGNQDQIQCADACVPQN